MNSEGDTGTPGTRPELATVGRNGEVASTAPVPELGIFARTFVGPTLAQTLDAVKAHGFSVLHFNFACAGLGALPEHVERAQCEQVRDALAVRGLRMLGVSATYNTINPDTRRRAAETERALRVIELAPMLGTRLVSLSTGTRSRRGPWAGHQGNRGASAWRDLRRTLERLVRVAEDAGVSLGIEPERHNVVSTARMAERLLAEMGSRALVVILDPANLVDPNNRGARRELIREAFDLLADRTVMLHAKDVSSAGYVAAGRGRLDYEWVIAETARHGLRAPIVIHEVAEDDVERPRTFLARQIAAAVGRFAAASPVAV